MEIGFETKPVEIQLQDKHLTLLSKIKTYFNKEVVSLHSYIEDCEGEEIYIELGKLPFKEDLLNIKEAGFDFIVASLLLRAKEIGLTSDMIDMSFGFLKRRWHNVEFNTELSCSGNSLVSLKGDYSPFFSLDYFNFRYKELGSYMARSFNSLNELIHEINGVEFKEEKEYDELGIEIVKNETQKITWKNVTFNERLFFDLYKDHLKEYLEQYEDNLNTDIMAYSSRGVPCEELEELIEENKKKVANLSEEINAILIVVKNLWSLPIEDTEI